MIVYIEQVLIDNFIINFFIILTLKAVLRAKFKKINITLSSLLGSIIALILPLFQFTFIFNTLIKILLSLTMVSILKKYKKFKEFILYYITFILTTFVYGGACMFLLSSFDKNFVASNYSTYSLPLGVITVIIFFIMLIIKNVFKNFYRRKQVNNFVYNVRLYNNQKCDDLTLFLDSGNNLVDNITNKPITIIDFNSLKQILEDLTITDIILNKTDKINKIFKNVHLLNVSSIGNNKNRILVVEIERLEIYLENKVHIINNAIVGLTLKRFINDLGYSGLLSPKILKELIWNYHYF